MLSRIWNFFANCSCENLEERYDFSRPMHLCRGDRVTFRDRSFVVGENISFKTAEDIDDFLANSEEIEWGGRQAPFLWAFLGGLQERVTYRGLVRKRM